MSTRHTWGPRSCGAGVRMCAAGFIPPARQRTIEPSRPECSVVTVRRFLDAAGSLAADPLHPLYTCRGMAPPAILPEPRGLSTLSPVRRPGLSWRTGTAVRLSYPCVIDTFQVQ